MPALMIFDLDGTLVDSRRDIACSLNYALEKEGFNPLPQEEIEDLVGWGAKKLVMDALGNPRAEDLQRVFTSFWNHYDAHLLDHTRTYPHVEEILRAVRGWHLGVITNKPQAFSEKILEGLDLARHFRWIIGGDKLAVQKPDPGVMAPIVEELGDFEPGVIVGDSIVDLRFGKAAGLTTVAITHGFGRHEDLLEAEPDHVIHTLAELPGLPLGRRP